MVIPTKIKNTNNKPQLIAMIHVHTNNILQNNFYCDLFRVPEYTKKDLQTITDIRIKFNNLVKVTEEEYSLPLIKECRGSIFILERKETNELEKKVREIPFVKYLIERALKEAEIFTRNGINILCIENIGVPYFLDTSVPVEDLMILNIIAKEIRRVYPKVILGVHTLISDIESIPIAIESEAYFI